MGWARLRSDTELNNSTSALELFPSSLTCHGDAAGSPWSAALCSNVSSGQGDWWPLQLYWQGEADPLQPELVQVDPVLRLLLLGDGLTTRTLAALTQEPIQAHLLDTGRVELLAEQSAAPQSMQRLTKDLARLGSPLLRRRVWLCGATSQQPLLYATSWWNSDHLAQYLPHPDLPIGQNLIQEKLETFREVRRLYYGEAEPVARLLNCRGPFWARHYLLLHRGQPLTVIYEVFSSRLQARVLSG
ncbi:chorismate lyase [Thermostichus sp. MS-CIW-21]|jgi:chorismate--pyruvate lyase|uniref:chorismate pyruvate-lyase family protein n=2 Tax=Synechococcus TaxID=1129 RepID=UPI001F0AE6A6|nr:chorismate pyruvate-lyase family protein [Synechococcus sp. 63AY4M1]